MKISSSLGKVQFVMELDVIAGAEQQAARDLLAAKNILFHVVGSKCRPDAFTPDNVNKLKQTAEEKLGGLFKLTSFEASEWVEKEKTSISLKGLPEDLVAELVAKVKAAKTAKTAPVETKQSTTDEVVE